MKVHDKTLDALRAITQQTSHGYTCWVTFQVTEDKLDGLKKKFAEVYGTEEPAHRRQLRKHKNIPNGVVLAAPCRALPGKFDVILLATENAVKQHADSAWSKESWRTGPVRFSRFQQKRVTSVGKNKLVMSWVIESGELAALSTYLETVLKTNPGHYHAAVKTATQANPMVNGVRKQLRKMLRGHQAWCRAVGKQYPTTINPDDLPYSKLIGA